MKIDLLPSVQSGNVTNQAECWGAGSATFYDFGIFVRAFLPDFCNVPLEKRRKN